MNFGLVPCLSLLVAIALFIAVMVKAFRTEKDEADVFTVICVAAVCCLFTALTPYCLIAMLPLTLGYWRVPKETVRSLKTWPEPPRAR